MEKRGKGIQTRRSALANVKYLEGALWFGEKGEFPCGWSTQENNCGRRRLEWKV